MEMTAVKVRHCHRQPAAQLTLVINANFGGEPQRYFHTVLRFAHESLIWQHNLIAWERQVWYANSKVSRVSWRSFLKRHSDE